MSQTNKSLEFEELLRILWKEKKLIFKTIIIFILLGFLIAFCSKKEYKSECNFLFDDNLDGSRVTGLIAQFGALAGVNLNSQQGVFGPELVPKIAESYPFLIEIMRSSIKVSNVDTAITVYQYMSKFEGRSFLGNIWKHTIGFVKKLFSFDSKNVKQDVLENNNIIYLTKEEDEILKKLSKKIEIILDDKTGLIYLRVYFSDAIAAADLNQVVYNKLMNYVIQYKLNKAKVDYDFIYARYIEAKGKYEKIQSELAIFRDQNKNISSAYVKTKEEQIQNEYVLAFNLYNTLAQQLEQAKIRLQEVTPVFNLIEKAQVPLKPSKPNKLLILLFFTFLGIFASISAIIFKIFVLRVKEIIDSTSNV